MKLIDFRKGDNIIKIIIFLLFLCVVAVCFIYSAVDIYSEESGKHEKNTIHYEQDYIAMASSHLDTLNPYITKSRDVYYISQLIYNSLFTYDENMACVPELVKEYEVNNQRGTINIKLKDDIKFSDGSSLDAYDVVFSVNALKNAGSNSLYYKKISKIYSAYVRSSNSLTITFRNAANCSTDDLVFPIVPSNQYASAYAFSRASDSFKPIGSGLYRYKSYDSLKSLKLVPNDEYWGEKAENDILFKIVPNANLASGLMDIEEVVCYYSNSQSRKAQANDKNFAVIDYINNKVEFLTFNTNNEILKDRAVRKAITMAIDTEKVLNNGYMEDGVLTDTLYYPNYLGVADEAAGNTFDLDGAHEILSRKKIRDKNNDGTLEDIEGEHIILKLLVNKNNSTREAASKIIKRNLEKAGFIVELYEEEYEDYLQKLKKNDFDIALTGYTVQADYNLSELFDGSNQWKYKNNELKALTDQLNRLNTEEDYQEIYKKVKKALTNEYVYFPLCYRKMSLIGVPTFDTGSTSPTFARRYLGIENWMWSKVVTSVG